MKQIPDEPKPQKRLGDTIFENFFQAERILVELAILILLLIGLVRVVAPELRALTYYISRNPEIQRTTSDSGVSGH